MRSLISRIASSLAARLIAVIVIGQVILLIVIALLQTHESRQALAELGVNEFGYGNALDVFDSLNSVEGYDINYLDEDLLNKRKSLWADLLARNPDFSLVREYDGQLWKIGDVPSVYSREKERFKSFEAHGERLRSCRTNWYNSDNVLVSFSDCPGESFVGAGLSGLAPGFEPINRSYLYKRRPTLVSPAVLWSYGIILFILPLLVLHFIRPVKKAAQSAQNISPARRGYQISEMGIFSEVRGFVMAINAALRRLDLGYQREIEFRNAIAHELKTPLTVLRARLQDVQDPALQDRLVRDTQRLNDLVDRLLDFAKTSSDPGDPRVVDLADVVQEACAHCGALALNTGVEIDYRPPSASVRVMAIRTAAFLAITNILNNAIQHSQTRKPIRVRVTQAGQVTIEDEGIGFEIIEAQSNLDSCEAFTRQSVSGHGLGLNIARQAMRLSNADLICESVIGAGTRFTLCFPMADARI